MLYTFNPDVERLKTEDESYVIFDPASGDTHFLDDTAYTILSIIEEDAELEALLPRLAEIYQVGVDDLRQDTVDFLNELVNKGILICESNQPT